MIFLVNNFGWTYDPRPGREPHHFPFLLYPFQEDYLHKMETHYQAHEDFLTDKSRDMGATWLFLAWDVWHWKKDSAFVALLGSRKEEKVDKTDDPDTLFYKARYFLHRLPAWLQPDGYDKNKHTKHMLLVNPVSGNVLTGESANADFSRQGRYSVIHFDEFAFWPFGNSSWVAAGDASPCRFPVSTSHGKNNKFAELRFNSNIKHTSLKWPVHPLKDQAWYEGEKARRTAKELAQEVDIDYEASGGDIWLPWYRLHRSTIELTEPIKFNDEWDIYVSLDYGSRNPSSVHFYGYDYDGNWYSALEFYGPSTVDELSKWIKDQDIFARVKKVYADPQLWAKDQEVRRGERAVLVSRADLFADQGINLTPGIKGHDLDAREMTKSIIEAGKLKIGPLCKMQKWEFKEACRWDDFTEQVGQARGFKETLADKNNHAWDDWKYLILNNPKPPQRPVAPPARYSEEWFEGMERAEYGMNQRAAIGG